MARKKVLVTGHAGLIGGIISRSSLAGKYAFSYLDKDRKGEQDYVANISRDVRDLLPAFEGKEVVVHLAADRHVDDPWEKILHNNIVGTYNVFEAARRAGVKRVVLASSIRASDMCQLGEIPRDFEGGWRELWDKFGIKQGSAIGPYDPVRPYNFYGVSKVFGESLGRYYSDRFGMSVICLRIGALMDEDKPTYDFTRRTWLSWRDGIEGIDKAIDAPKGVKFGIFYIISDNSGNVYDLSNAMEVLGYVPKDSSDDFE